MKGLYMLRYLVVYVATIMYLRISTVRRGPKTYRYAQIVESYRREDGKPTNRVIASLGRLDEKVIASVRAALAAARGNAPMLPAIINGERPRVRHSLRYLDLAVLLRVWREAGLARLLDGVLARRTEAVAAADIITALILHRCVAPASKLAASRWYPTTALPELQGVPLRHFNNSRVHRALSVLEAAEDELQRQLPLHIASQHEPATALIIDATDTWFVGQGPALAQKGIDKQGLYRRRIGIVLLCDHRGFPLCWHTLDGRFHDPSALGDMAEQVARLPWSRGVPLVVDRALGNAGWIDKLNTRGLRYITCVPATELESCNALLPWDVLDAMQKCGDADHIATMALDAGFVRGSAQRYVLELGVFDKSRPQNADRISQAMLSMQIVEALEASEASRKELAGKLGIHRSTLHRHTLLKTLGSEVRRRIRAGEADALGITQLQEIATVPEGEQVAALEAALTAAPCRRKRAQRKRVSDSHSFPARGALALNPVRLIDDRRADEARLAGVRATVEDINRRLAKPHSRRSDASALAAVVRRIRRARLGNVCTPRMTKTDGRREVILEINDAAWRHRRRSDGLALVVTHPEVEGSATERVEQYFAKDVVEKDFQTIKSAIGLRPIRHRTDRKTRAHVSVCVLALLLQRLLEARLAAADRPSTAPATIEQFEPIRLNFMDTGTARYYTPTEPGDDVDAVLRTLGLSDLVDDQALAQEITPR